MKRVYAGSFHNSEASSAVVKAMDLYSASTVGLDIVACFFAPQDMRLGPIKIPKPVMDLRSSLEPAQSASQYPMIAVSGL